MENLPSGVLDFNNNELNNNGASSNKCSSSNSSDSCSSGTSTIFSELLKYHDKPINVTLETAEEQDVLDDPLARFKTVSDETTVISEIPSATDIEEVFIVTPGEGKNLGHFLVMNVVKNLHIHIFLQQESLSIRLKGKYKLAQANISIKDFLTIVRNFYLIVIIYFLLIQFYRNCSLIVR